MNIQDKIKQSIVSKLHADFGHSVHASQIQIDSTRKEFEGDYTVVVFPFVRAMKMAPEAAGSALGERLVDEFDEIEGFNVIKGFLNLSLSPSYWVSALTEKLDDEGWLKPTPSEELILVEYSSPNTNKPLHLGHLRNNFLGHSVSLIKAYTGNRVIKTQIINDRGVHICKSMLAWQRWGNGETPDSTGLKGDKLVGNYYVKFDQELKKQIEGLVNDGVDPEAAKKEAPLMNEVQLMLQRWEDGHDETVELWKMMNSWVYAGFDKTYKRMGVEFDHLYYESETFQKGKELVLEGLGKNLFEQRADQSVWCDLEAEGLDSKLLIRGDGTTVYMTQDIGTAVQRAEDYPDLTKAIYTVGDEQDYHFKVLFKILEKLGYSWASSCQHLSYGMVDLPSGKMKSREGTVVDADDLMAEVVQAARNASAEKGKLEDMSIKERNELFEMLGIGALKFYLLRVDPKKRMMFDPEESVSLNGDTGPFVQYTHARCKSVLRRAKNEGVKPLNEIDVKERLLLRHIVSFKEVAKDAAKELSPSIIASYCIDLAKLYNQFYHDCPILKAEGDVKMFRLGITKLTADTLREGMALLGIGVPERM